MPMSERSKGIITGVAIGVGATLLAKLVGKPLAEAARPITKAGMRQLLEVRDRSEEWLAEAGESFSDIVAEVRAEREAARAEAAARAARSAPGSTGGTATGGAT